MVKAIWNGKVIADSDRTEIVEGNHYFPSKSLCGESSSRATLTRFAPGRAKLTITHSSSMGRRTPTPLGTTPIQSRRRRKSSAMLPSGKAFG
jgi:hypothetical protein